MKRWTLMPMVVLCLACAGEKPAEDAREATPTDSSVQAPADTPESAPAPGDPADPILTGRAAMAVVIPEDWKLVDEYTRMFYDGKLDALHDKFSAEAKSELPLPMLTKMREQMLSQFGNEVEVAGIKKEENQGYRAYKRAAKFSDHEDLVEVAWVIGPDESIAGLFITPQRKRPE